MATWNLSGTKHHLLLCNGGSCMLSHAEEVTHAIRDEITLHSADSLIHTTRTLCNGRCNDACTVVLYPKGIWYHNLTPSLGRELIRRLLDEKNPLPEQISYTYQHQQFVATGRAGLSGLDQHHTQTFGGLRVTMDKDQPGSELQMFPFARTSGNNLTELSITHGGTSVGAHSKNPERALMAYDLIRNDEQIYHLINYGLEGVQYEVKDGKRVQPEGYDEAKDAFYADFWGGRVDKFEIPSASTWDQLDETLYAEYDKIKKPYPYGQFVFDKSPVEAELTAITQVTGEMGPAITYGKAGDPAKAVEEFRSKLKTAGYEKVLAELQRQLDAYKKLIEG